MFSHEETYSYCNPHVLYIYRGIDAAIAEATGWTNVTEHLNDKLLVDGMEAIFLRHPSVQVRLCTNIYLYMYVCLVVCVFVCVREKDCLCECEHECEYEYECILVDGSDAIFLRQTSMQVRNLYIFISMYKYIYIYIHIYIYTSIYIYICSNICIYIHIYIYIYMCIHIYICTYVLLILGTPSVCIHIL